MARAKPRSPSRISIGIAVFLLVTFILSYIIYVYVKPAVKQSVFVPLSSEPVERPLPLPVYVQTEKPLVVENTKVEPRVNVPYARMAETNNNCGEYKQIGLLVGKDAGEIPPTIMPLFGRRMSHRDRFEYYTATDKEHLWKVPVQFERRDCQTEIGCAEIYDGDDVVVPDYANKTFRARIYKNTSLPRC